MSVTDPPCYSTRPALVLPVVTLDGWTLKPYRVLGRSDTEGNRIAASTIAAIRPQLPSPAKGTRRPGIAFVIEHLATPLDYIVLCWWENSNEVITRVFVREAGAAWRLTAGNESFCVWDLDIIWFERNAYIRTMLAAGKPDPTSYIEARFDKAAAG